MNKKLDNLTMLVVDDQADNLSIISKILAFFGATVYTARDGVEAISQLETNPLPDLIITDISMPHMDGWALLSAIKEKYQNLPIIAVTAHAMTGDKERVIAAGFDSYIPKPINVMEFIPNIVDILSKVSSSTDKV